ncbi:MAG TPA: hypothetical protein VFF35_07575 [Bacteroidia bacterium]|nr:hypothetical protein [Bacteroidia bacterium]
MEELPLKIRHFKDVDAVVSHTWHDVSEKSLEKRAFSLLFLDEYLDKKPKHPSLVSSAEGKIKKILFTIPYYIIEGDDNPHWAVYSELFQKLPEHTEIIILAQNGCHAFLNAWMLEKKMGKQVRLIEFPDYINFTIWAEDAYAIVKDAVSNKSYFIEPHSFPRWEDGFIADFVAKDLKWGRTQIPLYFEGGNILVGDDFFLIGADHPIISLKYISSMVISKKGESKSKLITRLYKKYLDRTRKIIYVGCTLPVPSSKESDFEYKGERWKQYYYRKNEGGTVQPIFHIDMFLTLAGRSENGKYRILVGDPKLASELINLPVLSYAMTELFDNIANNLIKAGFEVIRNPLPLIYFDDEKEKLRTWYFATSNNALVEIINYEIKTVWLPTYGYGNWKELKKTDDYNKKIWKDLGFKVISLGDFHPFIENSGSLHCIKKYLERA